MARRTQLTIIGMAVLAASALHGSTAQASDWRYCIAPSPAQHTIYMSAPFPTDDAMETIESEFGQVLDHALLAHDSVQCPRGDADTIAGMKQQAIQYNEASGNKVVQLNWRP
jgi:hypothetical protein